jgi:hypothetical protein
MKHHLLPVALIAIIVFPDQRPIISGGRTLVPVRCISESLGYKVDWDPGAQAVTISDAGKTVRLTIGSRDALVDGAEDFLDAPAMITGGRTMVPLRFISEACGEKVDYKAAQGNRSRALAMPNIQNILLQNQQDLSNFHRKCRYPYYSEHLNAQPKPCEAIEEETDDVSSFSFFRKNNQGRTDDEVPFLLSIFFVSAPAFAASYTYKILTRPPRAVSLLEIFGHDRMAAGRVLDKGGASWCRWE